MFILELAQSFFSSRQFIPHGHCYLWKPELVWLHLLSDSLIALAYYSIPTMLVYFVRQRRDVPFKGIFWLFSAFIVACGTTHLMAVWTLWHPTYWVSGTIKAMTALVSLYTASELFTLIPQALVLPSPEQLETANRSLAREIEERQQVEAALRESDRRFRAIFYAMFQFIGLLKPDGTLIEANQTALEFGGIKAEDIIDRPFWETYWWKGGRAGEAGGDCRSALVAPNMPDNEGLSAKQIQLKDAIARAAKGEFVRYEVDVWGANDTSATIDFSLKPIFDENGDVILIIPEGRDISARKQAEAEIRKLNDELEQRVRDRTAELEAAKSEYASLAQVSPVGIFRCDRDGNCTYVNERWSEIAGLPPQEALGTGWSVVLHPEDRDRVIAQWERSVSENLPFNAEYRFVRPDGTMSWVFGQVLPEIEHGDRIVSYIGTITDITERKLAEEALQISEEQRRLALDLTHIGSWDWQIETNEVIYNENHFKLLGLEPNAVRPTYQTWRDRVHPEDVEWVERAIFDALANQTELEAEYRVIYPDGSLHWLLSKGRGIYGETGEAIRMIGVAFDISDRKRAEEALKASEDRFRRSILDAPMPIILHAENGEVIFVNRSWSDITGYEPSAIPTIADWTRLAYGERQETVRATIERLYSLDSPVREGEFNIKTHAGTTRIWDFSSAPLGQLPDGRRLVISTALDVTERKQAEEALRESEEQYRMTFDLAAVGVCHVDFNGRWLRFNREICEITGYSHEELMGMTYMDITHPDDLETDLDFVRQLLAGTIANFSMEKRYIRKDGSTIWVNISVSLAREASPDDASESPLEKPKYMIGVVENINDRKQAELQLQQQAKELRELNAALAQTTRLLAKRNQELDRFVYVVSHDLKAPLRAIANLSTWIEEDLDGQLPEENQQQMELLRNRVHRMENLIEGLLDYSRVGRTELPEEAIDVGKLLDEIVDSLAPPETFTIEVQPPMPTIVAKRLLLNQVFANLIGNAIKHHDRPDGRVVIAAADKGDRYEFTVTDDGPGIDPEYHEKVFAIFQTLKARDVHESTGIGLSIVKKIIETEGGEITLDSKTGTGAIFRFTWLKQPSKGDRASEIKMPNLYV